MNEKTEAKRKKKCQLIPILLVSAYMLVSVYMAN